MAQETGPEPQSDQERRAFREALALRRARLVRGSRGFAAALMGLVAAGVLLGLPQTWWVPAVGFVAIAGLVFRLANWKCPACGERLPTRGGRRCAGCGLTIDD